jgi:hypothetical protein
VYRPANQCIYCGVQSEQLSREHIIPYSLGGVAVLPRASCEVHAKLTSAFEMTVTRSMYGIDRAIVNAPTRRRGKHEVLLNDIVDLPATCADGSDSVVRFKRRDAPRALIFTEMQTPGLLRGVDPNLNESVTYRYQFIRSGPGVGTSPRPDISSIGVASAPMDESALTRMLAKIAHAYTCAELGVNSFNPFLLPLIVGGAVSRTYFVGGFNPPSVQNSEPLRLREEIHFNMRLLLVEISLLMFPHFPKYQVIAGTR